MMIEFLENLQGLSRFIPFWWLMSSGIFVFLLGLDALFKGVTKPGLFSVFATFILIVFPLRLIGFDTVWFYGISAVCVFLAIVFCSKVCIIFLALAISLIVAFHFSPPPAQQELSKVDYQQLEEGQKYSYSQMLAAVDDVVHAQLFDTYNCITQFPASRTTQMVIVFLGVLIVGMIFPRLVLSLALSAMGVVMIAGGLGIALFAKMASPVTILVENITLCGWVAFGLFLLGTLTQLSLLCPRVRKVEEDSQGEEE